MKLPELKGNYRLLRRINSGGMGEIFLTEDTQLLRPVAIKILKKAQKSSEKTPKSIDSATSEARMLAQLNHPAIVQVFDLIDCDEDTGLVMEYVEGENLEDYPIHKLSVEDKLFILKQIAQGIAAAHKQGIVHCDIKPANIIIGEKNHIKIADFGIAQLHSTKQTIFNKTTQYGSSAYMSPQRLQGDTPNEQSDWFSFGILAFRLLGGFHPYGLGNQSPEQIIHNIQNSHPESAKHILPALPDSWSRFWIV
jgi:serine/threonine-protein kinase